MVSIALTMKTIILLAVIACVAANSEYYDLEKVDMNELLNNIDELQIAVDCVFDRRECTKVYGSYKAINPEAVEQACKRCSPYLKHVYWQFLDAMKTKLPNDYVSYRHKYDPENKYFDALESELRKYSIDY